MVDPGGEGELGGFEGVVCREVDIKKENSACKPNKPVLTVVCLFVCWPTLERRLRWAEDGGLPVEGIVPNRPGAALGRRVVHDVLQLFVDPLLCHLPALILVLYENMKS